METYGETGAAVLEGVETAEEATKELTPAEIKAQELRLEFLGSYMEAHGGVLHEGVTEEMVFAQIDRESTLMFEGVQKFQQQYHKAIKEGEAGETLAGRWLISKCIPKVAEQLEKAVKDVVENTARKRSRAGVLISPLLPHQLAFIVVRILVDATVAETPERTKVAWKIGQAIEEELNFSFMMEAKPTITEYWTRRANESGYEKAYEACMRKLKEVFTESNLADGFTELSNEDKVCCGLFCIEHAKAAVDIISEVSRYNAQGHRQTVLVINDQLLEEVLEFNHRVQSMFPKYQPMTVPPKPWAGSYRGGLVGEQGRRTKLVRKVSRTYLEDLNNSASEIAPVLEAVNAVQATPWRINKKVLDVLIAARRRTSGGFKLPTKGRLRWPEKPDDYDSNPKARQQYAHAVNRRNDADKSNRGNYIALEYLTDTAKEYRDCPRFYFPHNMDWRGRIYPITSYLSPQGNQWSRALLEFADGMAVGPDGFMWLALHGTACWGYDKVSIQERIEWAEQHSRKIVEVTKYPLEMSWWEQADDPWGFLAFCYEWAGFCIHGSRYVSHLPIAMDGSCNGLQNFAAMLRHEPTARAVNLAPSDKPNDIYSQVGAIVAKDVEILAASDPRTAEELYEDIKKTTKEIFDADTGEEKGSFGKVPKEVTASWDVLCAKWMHGSISRTLVKRPVMTYPYAVSEYGVRKQLAKVIKELVREEKLDVPYEHASKIAFMLKGPVFSAVRSEVWAAARAMDWLKEVVTVLSKTKLPVMWRSPIGFPIVQEYKKKKTKEVCCRIGKVRIRANVREQIDEVDCRAQASAIAPNFVHSCDAAHLQLTVLNCCRQGVKHFHMIHDSYGTHAGNATVLAATLRSTFIDMYTEDVLQKFVEGIKAYLPEDSEIELPEPPRRGEFDLSLISMSRYFFI